MKNLLHAAARMALAAVLSATVLAASAADAAEADWVARHFIILPDAIGAGKSAKPSDGARTKFPRYNYDDMVLSQYRLVTEGLGIKHLRLVIGNSMGGMHTWLWGVKYPEFMDALVPMASQPTEMSGRNWMLRRMLTESIRRDPDWNEGNYTAPPRGLKLANQFFGFATIGGNQALYKAAPTRAKADQIVDERLAAPFTADANDFLYQWEASRDYNPAPGLERIRAALLAINSADDSAAQRLSGSERERFSSRGRRARAEKRSRTPVRRCTEPGPGGRSRKALMLSDQRLQQRGQATQHGHGQRHRAQPACMARPGVGLCVAGAAVVAGQVFGEGFAAPGLRCLRVHGASCEVPRWVTRRHVGTVARPRCSRMSGP